MNLLLAAVLLFAPDADFPPGPCPSGPWCDRHTVVFQDDETGENAVFRTVAWGTGADTGNAQWAPWPWNDPLVCAVTCEVAEYETPTIPPHPLEPGDCWCFLAIRRPSPGRVVFLVDTRVFE